EKDEDRVEFLTDQYVATVIQGDGGRPSILRQTDLESADVVASLTDYGSMTNLGICMTARRIEPDIRTVARIDHGDDAEYEEMVDAVVYPEELAAHAAANDVTAVTGGGVRTIEEVTPELDLIEIEVAADAPVAGKRLDEVALPRGAWVVTCPQQDGFPSPETVFEAQSRYVLAVGAPVVDEVIQLLRG
ncbi:MAG: K+ transport system, NAD-binding component, partial [uncultured archaeon A07HB70]